MWQATGSGELAAAGVFPPHMMSRELPLHSAVMYRMTTPIKPMPPHCRGAAFPGPSPNALSSLEQAVSSAACPAEMSCSIAATTQTRGNVSGQKQLPAEITAARQTSSRDVWLLSSTSHELSMRHHPANVLVADSSSVVTQQLAQTTTVSVTCAKPLCSSSVLYHQQSAGEIAPPHGKVLPSTEVNKCSDVKLFNQQFEQIETTVSTAVVKLEPKVEMETTDSAVASDSGACHLTATDVKIEPLKHDIKSEVDSEECGKGKNEPMEDDPAKQSDTKPSCDDDVKIKLPRKGKHWLLCHLFAPKLS